MALSCFFFQDITKTITHQTTGAEIEVEKGWCIKVPGGETIAWAAPTEDAPDEDPIPAWGWHIPYKSDKICKGAKLEQCNVFDMELPTICKPVEGFAKGVGLIPTPPSVPPPQPLPPPAHAAHIERHQNPRKEKRRGATGAKLNLIRKLILDEKMYKAQELAFEWYGCRSNVIEGLVW